jgi:hypothetical protein
MNVGIGNEAAQFHFWEYLFRIFSTASLQCKTRATYYIHNCSVILLVSKFVLVPVINHAVWKPRGQMQD